MIGFLLVEFAVGLAAAVVVYAIFEKLFGALGWTGEDGLFGVIAVTLAIIGACFPVFWVDRWGKRVTGHSVLDNLPFIP